MNGLSSVSSDAFFVCLSLATESTRCKSHSKYCGRDRGVGGVRHDSSTADGIELRMERFEADLWYQSRCTICQARKLQLRKLDGVLEGGKGFSRYCASLRSFMRRDHMDAITRIRMRVVMKGESGKHAG